MRSFQFHIPQPLVQGWGWGVGRELSLWLPGTGPDSAGNLGGGGGQGGQWHLQDICLGGSWGILVGDK